MHTSVPHTHTKPILSKIWPSCLIVTGRSLAVLPFTARLLKSLSFVSVVLSLSVWQVSGNVFYGRACKSLSSRYIHAELCLKPSMGHREALWMNSGKKSSLFVTHNHATHSRQLTHPHGALPVRRPWDLLQLEASCLCRWQENYPDYKVFFFIKV